MAWPVNVRWCSAKLKDDFKLVDMILTAEKRSALNHLSQDAAHTPHVYRWAVSLRGHAHVSFRERRVRRYQFGPGYVPLILAGAPAVGTIA